MNGFEVRPKLVQGQYLLKGRPSIQESYCASLDTYRYTFRGNLWRG